MPSHLRLGLVGALIIALAISFTTATATTSFYYDVTDLGTLTGDTGSTAYSINDQGQIVGSSYKTDTGVSQAFLWHNGQMAPLPNRGTTDSIAWSIYSGHAFVGNNVSITDLNTLLPANSGWVLNIALGINNKGQIVGGGTLNGQNRAFLLTPVRVTT